MTCFMTSRPHEEEAEVNRKPAEVLLEIVNRLIEAGRVPGVRRKYLSVGDSGRLVQIIAHHDDAWREAMMKRSEVTAAKTTELVTTYNELTGKSIKKFSSRAAAEESVKKLLPPEEGRGRPFVDYVVTYKSGGSTTVRESSKRGMVLAELRKRKTARRSELTEAVGFETAGYIQKLIEVGHAEIR